MSFSKNPRIVITGSRGVIGKALGNALGARGYDVVGIDLLGDSGSKTCQANLLDYEDTRRAVRAVLPFSALVHTAALAHGQAPPRGESVININTKMTENVVKVVEEENCRFVFLSSVSVYGEDGRLNAVEVDDELRPSTDYGQSKRASELIILESSVANCDILRLAPVFDSTYMVNARARACLPGLSTIKLRLFPSPRHSLCSLDTVVQTVCDLLSRPPRGRQIMNVCDPQPFDQHDIVSWFPGLSVPVPVFIFRPFYWGSLLLPSDSGYRLRCLYWKLLRSNVYSRTIKGQDAPKLE